MLSPNAFGGIRRVQSSIWFGHGPGNTAGFFPVTPQEEAGVGLGQARTINVFQWPGGGAPTALVLGPSSWGFGIGPWGGSAIPNPVQLQRVVRSGF
jgi:hypothetical protein